MLAGYLSSSFWGGSRSSRSLSFSPSPGLIITVLVGIFLVLIIIIQPVVFKVHNRSLLHRRFLHRGSFLTRRLLNPDGRTRRVDTDGTKPFSIGDSTQRRVQAAQVIWSVTFIAGQW